VLFEETLHMI